MLDGGGATLWSTETQPALLIEADGVCVKNVTLIAEAGWTSLIPALKVTRAAGLLLQNVRVHGPVLGLKNEDGPWLLPNQLDLGLLTAMSSKWLINIFVPEACHVQSDLPSLEISPALLAKPGNHLILLCADGWPTDSLVLCRLELVTSKLVRFIPITAKVSESLTEKGTVTAAVIFSAQKGQVFDGLKTRGPCCGANSLAAKSIGPEREFECECRNQLGEKAGLKVLGGDQATADDCGEDAPAARATSMYRNAAIIAGILLLSLVTLVSFNKWLLRRSSEPFEAPLGHGLVITFRPLPPGFFQLGSPASDPDADRDEMPVTQVHVTRPFWVGETEITQAQWAALMGTGIRDQCAKHGGSPQEVAVASDLPMVFVRWDEATAFCQALQRRLAGTDHAGSVQLPTEVEWEYACRAGTSTRFSFGDDADTDKANFAKSRGDTNAVAMRVKKFPPNRWGLYDMHGNVAEWVRGAPAQYPGGRTNDWFVPEMGEVRMYRGGSWKLPSSLARSSQRNWRPDGAAADHIGFRVVWIPPSVNISQKSP